MKTINKNTAGFTLIEILITLLILSIGLLGLAGLQTKGLQFDQVAYMRSQAAIKADDIADRMRANVLEAQAGIYDIPHGTPATSDADCAANVCDSVTMTDFDKTKWKTALAATLPAGDGEITTAVSGIAAVPAVEATITIRWDESRKGATGTDCPNDDSNGEDLACFQMIVTL